MGDQLEQERELAGFASFGHEIDTVEIVGEDGFDSEIVKLGRIEGREIEMRDLKKLR